MNKTDARRLILVLSVLSLAAALYLPWKLPALLLSAAGMLGAVAVLYKNMDVLTDISPENPKMHLLRWVTLVNVSLLIVVVLVAAGIHFGMLVLDETGERWLAAALVIVIMLVLGNISPRLPFNRHTGLRLPWTVTDEDTWIVAHRILGYISIPLALAYAACIPHLPMEPLTLAVVFLWVGIPGGLSYLFYRKKWNL